MDLTRNQKLHALVVHVRSHLELLLQVIFEILLEIDGDIFFFEEDSFEGAPGWVLSRVVQGDHQAWQSRIREVI